MKQQKSFRETKAERAMQTEIQKPVQFPVKCPYCGASMVIKPSSYVKSIHDAELLVCSNYPDCNTYCQVEKNKKGRYLLLSTPADKKLREMRTEAHFYISMLIDNQIYERISDVYDMLIHRSSSGSLYMKHIGECREYGCKEIIDICIRELAKHKDKIRKFSLWQESSSTTPELETLLDDICRTIEEDKTRAPYDRFIIGREYKATVTNKTERNIFVKMNGLYDAMCHLVPKKNGQFEKGDKVIALVEKKFDNKEYITVSIKKI